MKKLVITLLVLFSLILISCTQQQFVCSDGTIVSDVSLCSNKLQEEVNQLKIKDKIREYEGQIWGECSLSIQCYNQGHWYDKDEGIECKQTCENNKCIIKECKEK